MTTAAGGTTALLIAAHGETQGDGGNEGVRRLARTVAAGGLVREVAVGFIKGAPTVGEALGALTGRSVIVYPLFAAHGYFTRDRLVQLLSEANDVGRPLRMLKPLGLDPGLPGLVADHVARTAVGAGFAPNAATAILLAHGSRRSPASREATEQVAREVARLGICRKVAVAFLEERPFLEETAKNCPGAVIVVGMFSGEGLHGARDAPRLIGGLGRPDVVYAGVIAGVPGIGDLIVRAVQRALDQPDSADAPAVGSASSPR